MNDYNQSLKALEVKFAALGYPLDDITERLLVTVAFNYGWADGRAAMNAARIAEQTRLNEPWLTDLNVGVPERKAE